MRNVLMIVLSLLSVFGCAGFGEKKAEVLPEIAVKYPENVEPDKFWQDKRLKERFELYWKLRWAGKYEDAFKREAPYFQEMVSIPRYRAYIKSNEEQLVITLNKHVQETERLHIVHCSFRMEKGGNHVDIADWWIYIGNDWYHVIRDRLVFPDES